jgi:hypothetical protein
MTSTALRVHMYQAVRPSSPRPSLRGKGSSLTIVTFRKRPPLPLNPASIVSSSSVISHSSKYSTFSTFPFTLSLARDRCLINNTAHIKGFLNVVVDARQRVSIFVLPEDLYASIVIPVGNHPCYTTVPRCALRMKGPTTFSPPKIIGRFVTKSPYVITPLCLRTTLGNGHDILRFQKK